MCPYRCDFVSWDCHPDVLIKLTRASRKNRSKSFAEILLHRVSWVHCVQQDDNRETKKITPTLKLHWLTELSDWTGRSLNMRVTHFYGNYSSSYTGNQALLPECFAYTFSWILARIKPRPLGRVFKGFRLQKFKFSSF